MQGVSGFDPPVPGEPRAARGRDPFDAAVTDALRGAAQGEFARCRIALTGLSEAAGRPAAERAICLALLALTALALGEDAEARLSCRRATAGARLRKSDGPRQRRCRRVALALVACARDLARGRDLGAGRDLVAAPALLRDPASVPSILRDYAAFVANVCARVTRRSPPGPLTPAETAVLRLLAGGRNATQIATLLGRSPHTVRTHVRNIRERLDTRGRRETLDRARELGILETERASG